MPTRTSNAGNPRRAKAWPWIWAALFLVAVLSAIGFGVAYIHASAAINCTNTALGDRSTVGQRDPLLNRVLGHPATAVVTDSDATHAVFIEVAHLQKTTRPAPVPVRAEFFAVIAHANAVLAADQQYRNTHPIGQC